VRAPCLMRRSRFPDAGLPSGRLRSIKPPGQVTSWACDVSLRTVRHNETQSLKGLWLVKIGTAAPRGERFRCLEPQTHKAVGMKPQPDSPNDASRRSNISLGPRQDRSLCQTGQTSSLVEALIRQERLGACRSARTALGLAGSTQGHLASTRTPNLRTARDTS
jgi:hypothetical protein